MTALRHPAWCNPSCCEPEHRHYSRTLTARGLPGAPVFALRLFTTVYAPLGEDAPLVEFEVSLDDGPFQQFAAVEADAGDLRWLHAAIGAVLHVYDAARPHLAELSEPDITEGGVQS